MASPTISIIVPIRNEERYLEQCLNSIKTQTFTDFEAIIVNDCSTDSSQEIIDKFVESDSRFTCYHTPKRSGNPGPPLNLGFSHAQGKYYTWLSGDCWFEPECFETLLLVLEENPDIVMAYADFRLITQITEQVVVEEVPLLEYNKAKLRQQCFVGAIWLFRATAKKKAGDYINQICEDYYMHLRLSEFGDFKRVPKFLGNYRNHSRNLTNTLCIPTYWRSAVTSMAKAKWQSAKYRVAYLVPEYDPNAMGWLSLLAMNSLSENFSVKYIMSNAAALNSVVPNSLSPKEDLILDEEDDHDEIISILEECHLIHCQNFSKRFVSIAHCQNSSKRFVRNFDLLEWIGKKPTVLHVLDDLDKWNAGKFKKFLEKNCCCISNIPDHPSLRWIPSPMPFTGSYPVYYEIYYRCRFDWPRNNPEIKVCVPQPMNLFESLERKKTFDIYVDEIDQGFLSMGAWEALIQGLTVIGRLSEITIKTYQQLWDELPPILNANTPDEVNAHLSRLMNDRPLVNDLGSKGRDWMTKYYTANYIVPLYEKVYFETMNKYATNN